ncbi:hypothetical protein BV22DRAFT_1126249 [Leucogyrophana mollusca]|uniref:Uncharacterized protein n=1 Tax=Leucogyrophana mollusca TaxID=85980 RepID=A0ACB8BTE9_9AGAM|nr:hypothetical protein BV22DRAFT_1126249 [Leucogyrophana mollusca]
MQPLRYRGGQLQPFAALSRPSLTVLLVDTADSRIRTASSRTHTADTIMASVSRKLVPYERHLLERRLVEHPNHRDSGLRGRGGAGFPSDLKWSFMNKLGWENDNDKSLRTLLIRKLSPRYPDVNADEGEPGTCKDAITEAYKAGVVGTNACYSGYWFDVYLRRGAGVYIRGEETILIKSLEETQGKPLLRKWVFHCRSWLSSIAVTSEAEGTTFWGSSIIPGGCSVPVPSINRGPAGLGTGAVVGMHNSTNIDAAIVRFSSAGHTDGRLTVLLELTKREGHTICALGDAAAQWPIQGLMRHFRPEVETFAALHRAG